MNNKRTPGSYVKGDPRAIAGGKKSSRAIPADLREARQLYAIEFEQIIYKYMAATLSQLGEAIKNPQTPVKELIVIKMVEFALKHGDLPRMNFLLDRTIGKIPEKLEVGKAGSFEKIHDIIIAKLESQTQSPNIIESKAIVETKDKKDGD